MEKVEISSVEQLAGILQEIPSFVDMTLVGGQAVALWREIYVEIYPEEFEGLPV